MDDHARAQDLDFVRVSSRIAALWIAILIVGGLLLLFYGDLLMELST